MSLLLGWNGLLGAESNTGIDRQALVGRHDVVWPSAESVMPLGNGEFAFNADGTGLQTFGGNTMAHWGWHSFALPAGVTPDQIPVTGTFQEGRPTGGDPSPPQAVGGWMFNNPHAFNLGRLRLHWSDGRDIAVSEVTDLSTRVELWTGQLTSSFKLDGAWVRVSTCVHPKLDAVAVRVKSALLGSDKLEIALEFPYPDLERDAWSGDFDRDESHQSKLIKSTANSAAFQRKMDDTTYYASLVWSNGDLTDESKSHCVKLSAKGRNEIEFTVCYADEPINGKLPLFTESQKACSAHWQLYWESGGAIDLSESRDSRWKELERRIVLSQYHMKAQSAGSYPSSEAGLMIVDNWVGRFHMEMVWWHIAHYALWDRWQLAEKSLGIYQQLLPMARQGAKQLGLKGALWPKGVGPDGISQPWAGNIALLWKQPHPMFFAELEYRLSPTQATLKKWAEIIEQTAEYMADYAQFDSKSGYYYLAPDMPPGELGLTVNSVFDLAYWRWGLDAAQRWRQRMNLPPVAHWDEVRQKLTPLPVEDGLYVHSTKWRDTFTNANRRRDHPDPIGVFGMLPLIDGVDVDTARQTVLKISRTWDWSRTWGWDYPWMAMAASRVSEPRLAVESLLMDTPRNRYDWRGVNEGGPCPYLPGNGGLLYAISMMAAGWDDAPDRHAPGFPEDGSWSVKWEGLKKAF